MNSIELPVGVALTARDAVGAQLQLMQVRAAIDARWAPEVARLLAALDALARAIEQALEVSR